jgi:hypothetical protein
MVELTPEWLTRFVTAVRRTVITEYAAERSCIATARVAIATARYFGISAEPLACSVRASSRLFETTGGAEGHSVQVVGSGVLEPATNGWDGHLVAILDRRFLVDGSADQFSRPGKMMIVEPMVVELPEWPLTGGISGANQHGVVMRYWPMADQRSFRNSPDWHARRPKIRTVVAHAIRALREPEPATT